MSTNRSSTGSVVLALLLCAPFLAQADATIANVATPSIQSGLGTTAAVAELVVGGYLTAYAVLLITGARLVHLHGYRRLFLVGAGVFGLTSLVAGLAPSPWVLVAARVAQGAGAALMYPQALTGIQQLFSGADRARAIGSFALALAGGAVSGQVLGGVLVWADLAGSGWRSIFLVNVPVCIAVVVLGARCLPHPQPRDAGAAVPRLDVPGVGALTVSLLAGVLPLTLGPGQGWPAWSVAGLVVAGPAFGVFLWWQRRTARRGGSPLVNVTVLARRPVVLALLALLTATATYYALLFTLAQYLQHGLGRSALFSGIALVPWVAAFGVAGRIAGRLSTGWRRTLAPGGYALMTVVYAAFAAVLATGLGLPDAVLLVLLAIGGTGLGASFNSLLGHLTDTVPAAYGADVSGASTTTLQIGGALGVAALGSVYASLATGTAGGAAPADHAFAVTTACAAAGTAVAAVLALLATRRAGERAGERVGDGAAVTPEREVVGSR